MLDRPSETIAKATKAPGTRRRTRTGMPSATQRKPQIAVEIVEMDAYRSLGPEWRALAARATEPNVFHEPAFLDAAAGAMRSAIRVVLAWLDNSAERQLVGCWALRLGRPIRMLPTKTLIAPAIKDYAFLGSPVLDRDHADAALAGMLEAIAASPTLPKLVIVRDMAAEGPAALALQRALLARRSPFAELRRHRRARLCSDLDGAAYFRRSTSASTRKKLRQHRKRLGAHGQAALATYCCDDLPEAFERFLALERSGWKGEAGTAILCRPSDTRFVRAAIRKLAELGLAWIEGLTVGGRMVSAQVMLRSGAVAFTWKIAHDESFAEFSPGVLLIESYTAKLLGDPTIEAADSCSHGEDGVMASMWSERAEMTDVLIDARRGASLAFRAVIAAARTQSGLRAFAKRAAVGIGLDPARVRHSLRTARSRWLARTA
jgi:CelD/BcsL family acetyltransferase involved in cellulose biosynthesis